MPVDPRQSILSAALFSRSVATDLCEALAEDDFTDEQRPFYRAIREVLISTGTVDPSSVALALERTGYADAYQLIVPYLDDKDSRIGHLMLDPSGRRLVAEHIRNGRIRRDLTNMVAEQRYQEIPPYLSSVNAKKSGGDGLITDERITSFMALVETNAKKTTMGHPTGLPTLDEITGGMIPGTLWAVGAPTSAGKTTLLCQMIAQGIRAGAKCLFYSLEMSLPLMYARLAGAWCNINPTQIYRGRLSDADKANVEGALRVFADFGLRVYREITDADEIVQRTREARLSKSVDIVAVDFLQNVTVRADNMLQRMAEASRILQGLAGECNCCVLVASQLSNEGVREKGAGLFSYRYASELAHAADIGLELVPGATGSDLFIRKNRHGQTGKLQVKFNATFSGFVDCDARLIPSARDLWGDK